MDENTSEYKEPTISSFVWFHVVVFPRTFSKICSRDRIGYGASCMPLKSTLIDSSKCQQLGKYCLYYVVHIVMGDNGSQPTQRHKDSFEG